MATKGVPGERLAGLREFTQEFDQPLYDFIFYMVGSPTEAEDLALSTFREFGHHWGHLFRGRGEPREPFEARIRLFRVAWSKVHGHMVASHALWPAGRDTRRAVDGEKNLLIAADGAGVGELVVARLGSIDPDFRAALVLRDMLGIEDEQVVRILGLRWGVYRHRLHRARLDLLDGLRGGAA